MIGKLKGTVDSVYDDYFVIDVSGVGYLVFASGKTLSLIEVGQFLEVMIETHVREDHIRLYGFLTLEEKSTFNVLQSVKGVGTRMALAILSQMSTEEIQNALSIEDKAAFNNVSGVGKKLAERIITELKDKFVSTRGAGAVAVASMNITSSTNKNDISGDAVLALTGLGINRSEAFARVSSILSQNPEISINDLIRVALKN
ncbi:MAG TPA: Holliday junction branch migration protein RuvA [Candidatus Megaira endosymbiont of Nemacystus decipiens]|nr:Holliday junction branch migration protein RuvA [Candidatus Megaera endosymbiont of Nemacystus decipiens]